MVQVASATATRYGLSIGLLGLEYDQINISDSDSDSDSESIHNKKTRIVPKYSV